MPRPVPSRKPQAMAIAFVLLPRFNMMSLAALLEPMRIANYLSPHPLYRWEHLSAEGGELRASNGMVQTCLPLAAAADPALIFLCGSWGSDHYHNTELFNWLRRHRRRGAEIAAIELGVYVLARAGLIGSRLATTHWSCMPGFAEQFPQVQTREQLYTRDHGVLTCAGGVATLDLGLALVAEHHGEQLALEVAEQIMHHPVRGPEAPQRHTLGAATENVPAGLRAAVRLIEQSIEEPLAVPEIAAEIGMSQRQLERLFKRYIGCSAVQFSQLVRLQHARVLLTSTEMSIREVSAATGFNSMSYFSQVFARCFGKRPSEYRRAWPEQEPAPSWPGTVVSFLESLRLPERRPRGSP